MLKTILDWAVQNPWFKKVNTFVAGLAAGMWFQAAHWHQIRATLDAWGWDQAHYLRALIEIAGVCAGGSSVLLTMIHERNTKANNGGNGDAGLDSTGK